MNRVPYWGQSLWLILPDAAPGWLVRRPAGGAEAYAAWLLFMLSDARSAPLIAERPR